MSYRDRLSPWCIIQFLPNMQRLVLARFRKRNDAEAHLRALRRLNPTQHYEIGFDSDLPMLMGGRGMNANQNADLRQGRNRDSPFEAFRNFHVSCLMP
jgi:hypothetical protein